MGPTTFQNRGQGGYPIGRWVQKSTKFRSWVLLWLLGCLGGVLGASWGRFGTVLSGSWVPTWVPKWSQLEQKIDPKINHFLDASWNRFLNGFWWNFVPKRSQVGTKMGSKIDDNFEERFLIILALPAARAGKIKIWGSKLGAKIDQKSIQK